MEFSHLKWIHGAYLVFLAWFPLENVEGEGLWKECTYLGAVIMNLSSSNKGNYLRKSHPEK